MKSLLFCLTLIIAVVHALDVDCPTEESISPCTCQPDDSGSPYGLIVCSGLKSIEEYEKVVDKSEDYPFTRVKFLKLSMLYFPISTQVQKRYHEMSIEDSSFSILFNNLSRADTTLLSISLKNVALQRGLHWGIFKQFRDLQTLEILDMNLKEIGNDFGEAIPASVRNVTISNTQTPELGNGTFLNMTNLQNIAITNNLIKSISRSMFPSSFTGLTLNFSNNLIETLPSNIFTVMPQLREVSFSGNRLTAISQTVFGALSTSIHVALEGSPIDCDCDVRWLTTVSTHAYFTGICAGINTNKGKQIERLLKSDFDYCLQKGKRNLFASSKNMLTRFYWFKHTLKKMTNK